MTKDPAVLAVMAFGAVVAVAGIALMFYAKAEGANRIRAFGFEFELSTPALVVFLAGCTLVVAPLFIASDGPGTTSGGSGDESRAGFKPTVVKTHHCENDVVEVAAGPARQEANVLQIPIRLRNVGKGHLNVFNSDPQLVDQDGEQLKLASIPRWDPPQFLSDGAAYSGQVNALLDGKSPSSVRLKIVVHGNCTTGWMAIKV